VLCAASLLSERKKGLPLLLDALADGPTRPICLVLLGDLPTVPSVPNVEIVPLGYVANDQRKALAYNSADVYVHPSLADNSPNTVIESLACGTPVVGLPVDGVPEMVRPGETGWLAPGTSAEALRAILVEALDALTGGDDRRTACRAFAEREFELSQAVRRYTQVFRQMVDGRGPGPGLHEVH
jgi:glycosyltransferase involved in cell wall biosynthesis